MLLTAEYTRPALDAAAFVAFVTQHFDCYWLTTHRKGERATALRYLAAYLPPSRLV